MHDDTFAFGKKDFVLEDVLSVNEQIKHIKSYNASEGEEKFYELISGQFNPFNDFKSFTNDAI